MGLQRRLLPWMVVAFFCSPDFARAITVLKPAASTKVKLAEGVEFSAYVKGNRWDMSDAADITTSESKNLINETFSNGIYSAVTADSTDDRTDSKFYLTWPGLPGAEYSIESGQKFPIDTLKYRKLTIKIRHLDANGLPTNSSHPVVIYFFRDQESIRDSVFGVTKSVSVPSDGNWHIVQFDLVDDVSPNSKYGWIDFSQVKGLRVDPTVYANTRIEVDWIRLTAAGDASTSFNVQWSGGTEPFSVIAQPKNDTAITMATGLKGTSANVDFSTLPSGEYSIEVTGGQDSGTSTGILLVNEAPLFSFLQPDIRGDVDKRYSLVEAGNPWGPFDSADIYSALQLTNISFANPLGSLTATSTGSDSRIIFDAPKPIDTQKYRMLSYSLSVSGNRDITVGSVARVFWGSDLSTLNTSKAIILQEGLNTYEMGDLRNLLMENGLTNQWQGTPKFFRIDPHEFPMAKDIRLDNVTIAPLDSADPTFNVTWVDSDPDDNATIALFADIDHIPGNSNEVLISSGISEDGSNSFVWNAPDHVTDGEYFLYARINDGLNETIRYATGAISVSNDDGGGDPPTGGDVTGDELRNISTRADVRTGNEIMIGGFIISGNTKKCVLVQGLGPSVGVPGGVSRLTDPVLTLKSGQTTIAQNDNWQLQDNPADVQVIQNLGWAPKDILESAIYTCLDPGAYTALLTGYLNTAGTGIVAVFDADDGTAYLSNISTRTWVGSGDMISIAGFIITGNTPKQVLVRGLGPSMQSKFPPGSQLLLDPKLRLYRGSTLIAINDDWGDAANAAEISALPSGLPPSADKEPAILLLLEPGVYTTHLMGVNSSTGIGNVAVYDLTGR